MALSRRILLDSNVWRYIVDAGALPKVQKTARASRHRLLVAPAVLYEAAHTSDKAVRDAILTAMSLSLWTRLMPEAYSESEELKAEVKRLRPEWLRQVPDLRTFNREFLQQQHKISDGTPVDTQIGTYLLDADLMLSADKPFVKVANRVKEDALFLLAESRCVPAGASAADAVLDELTTA